MAEGFCRWRPALLKLAVNKIKKEEKRNEGLKGFKHIWKEEVVNKVVGKRKYRLAKTRYIAVVTEVDAVAVVEHSEGERLEKSFEKLVLGLRRARMFECKANEGWAIVPVAVSRRSWLLCGVFEVRDDAAKPVNGLGALLTVVENGIGFGKVDYVL